MAKRQVSVRKREREQQKREREVKKAEKAAEKRRRREAGPDVEETARIDAEDADSHQV